MWDVFNNLMLTFKQITAEYRKLDYCTIHEVFPSPIML